MRPAGVQSASHVFVPPAMFAARRIRRAPRLFPFMLQCLIVRRKRIGCEIGGLLVVARLAARACRASGVKRIGGESFLLLDDFRNFLKIPISGSGVRRQRS